GKDHAQTRPSPRQYLVSASAAALGRGIRPAVHKKKPGRLARAQLYATDRKSRQATFFIALDTPLLIGSAVSVATFCAMPASSLPWPVRVSKCSRACLVESSTNSDGDFTPNIAST